MVATCSPAKSRSPGFPDLVGKKFGAGGSIPAFQALGFTIVQTFPPDTYENLSRGVIDATQMGFVPTVNLKWYEMAKYYMWDGTYAAGNAFTVNLDTWAKLTPETQQIFKDAAKDSETFSLDLDKTDTEANLKILADAGVTVGTLTARGPGCLVEEPLRCQRGRLHDPCREAGHHRQHDHRSQGRCRVHQGGMDSSGQVTASTSALTSASRVTHAT